MSNIEIAEELHKQLTEAQREHLSALAKFNELMKSVPTGDPNPDASQRVQQIAEEGRAALRHYMHALDRYTDFLVRGIVPEDLKRSG